MYLEYTRFFVRYDDFSVVSFILGRIPTLFFLVLAILSYNLAKDGNNPGYVEWENFRTPAQLNEHDDRVKWSDSAYRRKKATEQVENYGDEGGLGR